MSGPSPTRVLIVEPDSQQEIRLREALDGDAWRCVGAVRAMGELASLGLDDVDTILCAPHLPDGSAADALALVRGHRSEIAFIVTSRHEDAPTAAELVRSGATDWVVLTGGTLRMLPLILEKCLVQHRHRVEGERLQLLLNRTVAELSLRNERLEAVIRQLEKKARTDELTALSNRRWFDLMLEASWAEAVRHDLPLSLMMIDLDGFKQLNDTAGHQRGDEMLKIVSRVLHANCREVDTCARLGGDEFCVLMPHTRAPDALRVATRVRDAFTEAAPPAHEGEPRLTMSIGIAEIDLSRPVNTRQLVQHADEALYAAKNAGRDRAMVRLPTSCAPCLGF